MKNVVLVIDDEPNVLSALSDILQDEGYSVFTAPNGRTGLKIFDSETVDLVLLDIRLPDINAMKILKTMKSSSSPIEVIMISGYGTIELAILSLKLGAYDFIEKPLSLERVRITVSHALEKLRLKREKERWETVGKGEYELLGESKAMEEIRKSIQRCAQTDSIVFITGEAGTGKELVASAIQCQSKRKDFPLVKVNCATIPRELIESELFGHEKGAFTGAISKKLGKFELADKGTIFLDEIGDMDISCQAKVLRTIETGELETVGGSKSISVDVRVIAATNKNILKEIEATKFREDLYYKLNVVPIHIPPLRSRRSDIPILATYFLNRSQRESGTSLKVLDDSGLSLLRKYDYPGNIRELKNIMERLAAMVSKEKIEASDIAPILEVKKEDVFSTSLPLSKAKIELEKQYIETQLKLNEYDIGRTAKSLRIERTNLYRKLNKLGIRLKSGKKRS